VINCAQIDGLNRELKTSIREAYMLLFESAAAIHSAPTVVTLPSINCKPSTTSLSDPDPPDKIYTKFIPYRHRQKTNMFQLVRIEFPDDWLVFSISKPANNVTSRFEECPHTQL
jgi:hypothetical protein